MANIPAVHDSAVDATYAEHRWPATLALVVALILYIRLPDSLIYGPSYVRYIIPALELITLVPLQFATPYRHIQETRFRRALGIFLIALINFANLSSLVLLIDHLLKGTINNGSQLVASAALIWLTNVIVFGLWYWELDRGGPGARCSGHTRIPDFLFPQMSSPRVTEENWHPSFMDYLYVSFTNASAFSPTDTMPLTEWAKALMMVQSAASLITMGLVFARAVNILH